MKMIIFIIGIFVVCESMVLANENKRVFFINDDKHFVDVNTSDINGKVKENGEYYLFTDCKLTRIKKTSAKCKVVAVILKSSFNKSIECLNQRDFLSVNSVVSHRDYIKTLNLITNTNWYGEQGLIEKHKCTPASIVAVDDSSIKRVPLTDVELRKIKDKTHSEISEQKIK